LDGHRVGPVSVRELLGSLGSLVALNDSSSQLNHARSSTRLRYREDGLVGQVVVVWVRAPKKGLAVPRAQRARARSFASPG
jgi:hypothetical protein